MSDRIFNFSAGPAVLPESVLMQAKEAIWNYKKSGMGIMEISHRSKLFETVVEEAIADFKFLLGIDDQYEVLFLQGGASLQFYMVPLNLHQGKVMHYISTGAWSQKAIQEARRIGPVEVIASSEDKNFNYIPSVDDSSIKSECSFIHFTSNNTIFGTQFKTEPLLDKLTSKTLVCDASSDFLCRPLDMTPYGLIYAGAQKNLGPSGITVVVIHKDWIKTSKEAQLSPMLSYATHAENGSLYNTPPTFAIYLVGQVLKWIKENGNLAGMQKQNEDKAAILYNYIDQSKAFKGTANVKDRSLMNVTFRLPNEELEKKFIKEAEAAGLNGLKGHRSVGGMRASIYNAFPKQGVVKLVEFMEQFEKTNC